MASKILSDHGRAFLNQTMACLTTLAKIKHLKTSGFRPQTNGLVEAKNKNLAHGLRALLTPDVKEWWKLVKSIQFAYSVIEQTNLGLSSYEILYNQKSRLAIDSEIINQAMKANVPGFCETFLPKFTITRRIIEENIKEKKERMKYYHDLKARPNDIKVGDRVYRLIETTPAGIYAGVSGKLVPRYHGPYIVTDMYGNAARLRSLIDGKTLPHLIHVTKKIWN